MPAVLFMSMTSQSTNTKHKLASALGAGRPWSDQLPPKSKGVKVVDMPQHPERKPRKIAIIKFTGTSGATS